MTDGPAPKKKGTVVRRPLRLGGNRKVMKRTEAMKKHYIV